MPDKFDVDSKVLFFYSVYALKILVPRVFYATACAFRIKRRCALYTQTLCRFLNITVVCLSRKSKFLK